MKALVALTCALLFAWTPASADVLWDFSSPLGPVGADKVYPSGGFSVDAHAFLTTTTDGVLWEKSDGAEEQGVGVCPPTCPGDHEITPGSWLRVDLAGATGLVNWQIDIDSVQAGESYSLFTSSNPLAFGAGTSCGTALTDDTLGPLCGGAPARYLFITADAADIDLHRLSATVPAPAALLLLGLGLLGVAGLLRR